MAQRKAEGGGRWMEGLEKVADCKTCLQVWKGKKLQDVGTLQAGRQKKREEKNN